MMQIDPVALGDWALEREKRLYDHLLLHPFFPATITAIDLTRTPYRVQVQRRLETSQDGAWYACPAFTPRVGDEVVLTWQEDSVAVVAFLLSRNAGSRLLTPPTVLSAPATSVAFLSLPQNYQHLKVKVVAQTTNAAPCNLIARVNSDGNANYFGGWASFEATAAYTPNLGATSVTVGGLTPSASLNWATSEFTIFNYSGTNRVGFSFLTHRVDSGTSATTTIGGGVYTVGGPITVLQLLPSLSSFSTGSEFWLYGEF